MIDQEKMELCLEVRFVEGFCFGSKMSFEETWDILEALIDEHAEEGREEARRALVAAKDVFEEYWEDAFSNNLERVKINGRAVYRQLQKQLEQRKEEQA